MITGIQNAQTQSASTGGENRHKQFECPTKGKSGTSCVGKTGYGKGGKTGGAQTGYGYGEGKGQTKGKGLHSMGEPNPEEDPWTPPGLGP